MADLKVAYAAEASITFSGLDGLADGSSVTSSEVDNSSNLYPSMVLHLELQGDSASNTDLCYVWLKASDGAGTAEYGTDAADWLVGTALMNGTTAVDAFFVVHDLPAKFKVRVQNESGDALETTGSPNVGGYQGMYWTSS